MDYYRSILNVSQNPFRIPYRKLQTFLLNKGHFQKNWKWLLFPHYIKQKIQCTSITTTPFHCCLYSQKYQNDRVLKLKRYDLLNGIRDTAHAWYISYLSNCLQSVIYNGYESDFKVMKCGVPQGSILGHLPFLIYINDLSAVSKFFMPILFADGTDLFCMWPSLRNIVCQINQEVETIYLWVKANKLSLNFDQTHFMLFKPKRFPRNMDNITIDWKRILEVSETKFLWVIIDKKLNWKPHITYISKKSCKRHWYYTEG